MMLRGIQLVNLKKTTDDFYQISKTLLYSESLTVSKTGEVIKLGWFHKILYTHMRDQYIFCEINSNLYFESQESMAKKLCCSERNIRDGVKTLLKSSMITVKKRGKSNVYTVKDVFDKDFELSYKPNKIVKESKGVLSIYQK